MHIERETRTRVTRWKWLGESNSAKVSYWATHWANWCIQRSVVGKSFTIVLLSKPFCKPKLELMNTGQTLERASECLLEHRLFDFSKNISPQKHAAARWRCWNSLDEIRWMNFAKWSLLKWGSLHPRLLRLQPHPTTRKAIANIFHGMISTRWYAPLFTPHVGAC